MQRLFALPALVASEIKVNEPALRRETRESPRNAGKQSKAAAAWQLLCTRRLHGATRTQKWVTPTGTVRDVCDASAQWFRLWALPPHDPRSWPVGSCRECTKIQQQKINERALTSTLHEPNLRSPSSYYHTADKLQAYAARTLTSINDLTAAATVEDEDEI